MALQARDLRYEASAVQQQARRATNFGQKELAIRLMREAEDLRQEATRLEQEEEARLMEERWAKENGDGPGQYRKGELFTGSTDAIQGSIFGCLDRMANRVSSQIARDFDLRTQKSISDHCRHPSSSSTVYDTGSS